MRFALIIILLTSTLQSAAQVSIEGEWLTTECQFLFKFQKNRILCEQFDSARYKIENGNLIWQDEYSRVFKIEKLSNDSLVLVPINKYARTRLLLLVDKDTTIKFYRRELSYIDLKFDSIIYEDNAPPIPYLPGIFRHGYHLRVKVISNSCASFSYQRIDSIHDSNGQILRRLRLSSDSVRKSRTVIGKLNQPDFSELKSRLNRSNIEYIKYWKNLAPSFHGPNPSTLIIYKDGKEVYSEVIRYVPETMAPFISFLYKLDSKIERQ